MALESGKFRAGSARTMGKGPLDPALPQWSYFRPSLLWQMASRLPLILVLLVAALLTADRLGLLPSWVPFSSTHAVRGAEAQPKTLLR